MFNKKEYSKKWRENNKEKCIEAAKKWYRKNRKKALVYAKKRRNLIQITPELRKEYNKKKVALYWKHHDKYKEAALKRYKKLRLSVLIGYSENPPKCACCGEKEINFLSLDHINGGGIKHRKQFNNQVTAMYRWIIKNNFPKGFRILCMNCNASYGHYGYCPHKKL